MYPRAALIRTSSLPRAGVDHALPGVGRDGVVGLLGGLARAPFAPAGGHVDEAAVVDLAGPGRVVELALEVLAPRHEDERLLERGVIGREA
jgi:hypothetical protein